MLSEEIPAKGFKGYFVARFSRLFKSAGISYAGKIVHALQGQGQELSGWVTFEEGTEEVDVRVGVSFISVDQARRYVLTISLHILFRVSVSVLTSITAISTLRSPMVKPSR